MEKAALKEHRRHSTADKPFSYYISNIPEYFPNAPMHWHKEFELNVILEGEGDFVTGDIHFTAYKGDIAFRFGTKLRKKSSALFLYFFLKHKSDISNSI